MSVNLAGLGFVFSAVDNGLLSFQAKALRGFQQLTDSLESMQGFTANFTSDSIRLTTSLEANRQIMLKSSKALLGNKGVFEGMTKLANQSVALAESTGIGINTTTEAVRIYDKFSAVLKESRLGAVDLARFLETFSIEGTGLHDFLKLLSTGDNKLKPGEIERVLSNIASYGAKIGNVSETFSGLFGDTELLQAMKTQGVAFDEYIEGILKAQLALSQGSGGAAKAQELVKSLTGTLLDSSRGFQQLVAGMGSDIPEALKNVTIAGQNVQAALQGMGKGPEHALQMMVDMLAAAKTTGNLDFVKNWLGGAFDPQLVEMVTNNIDAIRTSLTNKEPKGPMSIKETLAAAVDPKTAQQQLETLEDDFEATFRSLGQKTKPFIQQTRKVFGELKKEMKALAGDESSSLGKVIKGLADVSKFGAIAFFPKDWQSTAQIMGVIGKTLSPVLEQLKLFGVTGFNLMSGFNLALMGGMALWVKYQQLLKEEQVRGREDPEAFAEDRLMEQLDQWIEELLTSVNNFFKNDFPVIVNLAGKALEKLDKAVGRLLRRHGPQMLDMLKRGFNWVWEGLEEWWAKLDLAPSVAAALDTVTEALRAWLDSPDTLGSTWDAFFEKIQPSWDKFKEQLGRGWDLYLGPALDRLFQAVGDGMDQLYDRYIKPAWDRFYTRNIERWVNYGKLMTDIAASLGDPTELAQAIGRFSAHAAIQQEKERRFNDADAIEDMRNQNKRQTDMIKARSDQQEGAQLYKALLDSINNNKLIVVNPEKVEMRTTVPPLAQEIYPTVYLTQPLSGAGKPR